MHSISFSCNIDSNDWNNSLCSSPSWQQDSPPDWTYFSEGMATATEQTPLHRVPLLEERGYEARTDHIAYSDLEPSCNWQIDDFSNYLNSQQSSKDTFDSFSEFFPEYQHIPSIPYSVSSPSPTNSSSPPPAPPASDELATKRYKAMMAARKARAKKAQSLKKNKEDQKTLEQRNIELKSTLLVLEQQVESYKNMILLACGGQIDQSMLSRFSM